MSLALHLRPIDLARWIATELQGLFPACRIWAEAAPKGNQEAYLVVRATDECFSAVLQQADELAAQVLDQYGVTILVSTEPRLIWCRKCERPSEPPGHYHLFLTTSPHGDLLACYPDTHSGDPEHDFRPGA
jgi:hypothetical protein